VCSSDLNNFIILYNQSDKPVMRLARQGKNEKNIIDKIMTDIEKSQVHDQL
jgi:hypothetical protein